MKSRITRCSNGSAQKLRALNSTLGIINSQNAPFATKRDATGGVVTRQRVHRTNFQ